MKKMIYVQYKWSELKWCHDKTPQPDVLDPLFLNFVNATSEDVLLVFFSKYFYCKIIAIVLLIVGIVLFVADLSWISYLCGFMSLISLIISTYYYSWWKNNYPLKRSLNAIAESYVKYMQAEQQTETIDKTKTE
jgi:hypothetical protein